MSRLSNEDDITNYQYVYYIIIQNIAQYVTYTCKYNDITVYRMTKINKRLECKNNMFFVRNLTRN